MNIACLSSLNPEDIHNWPGTLYFIYRNRQIDHNITWIGRKIYMEVVRFHYANFSKYASFATEKYITLFRKILSDRMNRECYDLIICCDHFFLVCLTTRISIIHIGDITFSLFEHYLQISDPEFIRISNDHENKVIQKATHLIYPSEWVKADTVDGVFSKLTNNKMVIYPFISEQKDFGYSDITQGNMENRRRIREHFAQANDHFRLIEAIYKLNDQ